MPEIQRKNLVSLMVAFMLAACSLAVFMPGIANASPASSQVGIVNYQLLLQQHPDSAKAQATYNAAVKQAQDDFNAKAAKMNDQDKKAYAAQLQQGLQQKQMELLNAVKEKINAAIKAVADSKGLTVVLDKNVAPYGGQDITNDVLKKITGK